MNKGEGGIQSLARGLHIIDLIANADRSLGVTEMAQELNIDKSSVSRLVKTLVAFGYLQPEPSSRRFTLGNRLYHIGWQMLNLMPVRQYARPYLNQLVEETGECAHTAVYAEGKALVIDDVETETSLRVVNGTGRMIPLHCTALGKVLLAFCDAPMPKELPYFTDKTFTTFDSLKEELERTKQRGYAIDDEEYDAGIRCMAAPIYNHMGIAVAVMGISGPTVRVTPEHVPTFAARVMEAANALSIELGYVPPT